MEFKFIFMVVAGILAGIVIISSVVMAMNRRDQLSVSATIVMPAVALSRDEPLPVPVESVAKDDEGWEPWGGGECPVPKGTLIDVKYRAWAPAFKIPAMVAVGAQWATEWNHTGHMADIVAWRLHRVDEPVMDDGLTAAEVAECRPAPPILFMAAEEEEKADADARQIHAAIEEVIVTGRRFMKTPTVRNAELFKKALEKVPA